MECTAVQKILDASADGELDLSAQIQVDAHLEGCGRCASQLGLTLAIKEASRSALRAEAPDELRASILRSLENSDAPPTSMRWKVVVATSTTFAAIAIGALVLREHARWDGGELIALRRDFAVSAGEGPEALELVGESKIDKGGQRAVHHRLGTASLSVLSGHAPIALSDQRDVGGAVASDGSPTSVHPCTTVERSSPPMRECMGADETSSAPLHPY